MQTQREVTKSFRSKFISKCAIMSATFLICFRIRFMLFSNDYVWTKENPQSVMNHNRSITLRTYFQRIIYVNCFITSPIELYVNARRFQVQHNVNYVVT